MSKEIKEYTMSDLIEAVKEERAKTFYVLNYLLNKNSRPLSEGGMDYDKTLF